MAPGFGEDVIEPNGGLRDFWRDSRLLFTADFNRRCEQILHKLESQ